MNRFIRSWLLAVLAMVCLLSGCQKEPPPDAAQLLQQTEAILSNLDSYSVRMSVDIRATPENGDAVAQPSYSLDTHTQITTGCKTMVRSAQSAVYQNWSWYLASCKEYQFAQEDGPADYYYSCNNQDYVLQERPTVDYRLNLGGYFTEDVTAQAVRYEGSSAYLLSGTLKDAQLEQLLPPDGAVTQLLQQVQLPATVKTYLSTDTLLPIRTEISYTDPEGKLLEAMDCVGGKLNICRISLTYNSFDQLTALVVPQKLANPTVLEADWHGPQQENGAVCLGQQISIPIPLTYTLNPLSCTTNSLSMQQTTDGCTTYVTYQLIDSTVPEEAPVPKASAQETVSEVQHFTLEPITVSGRTVSGAYTTYHSTKPDGPVCFNTLYCLYTPLDNGMTLQCRIHNFTKNELVYKVDAAAAAEQFFASLS